MFLEGEQTPGGPASKTSSGTKTEGGGGEEGGRRASVTSAESEISICSLGQLGNTIANSEWEGRSEPPFYYSIMSCECIPGHEVSQL